MGEYSIDIYNILGRQLYIDDQIDWSEESVQLNTTLFSPGVYVLKLVNRNTKATHSIKALFY